MLVLNQGEVRRLLPMRECMELMAEALAALGRGEATNPLRWGIKLPGTEGLLGLMPGYLGSPETLGLKAVTVFPGNRGTPYESHQGVVLLFDVKHGLPQAIIDASEVTAIRTAAVSGVATRALARPDAGDLAILGSGVQARTHLEAMLIARSIRRVRVWSPTAANREAFARREAARHGIPIEALETARDAVAGADLICTTTAAREPILHGVDVAAGAHINAVGSSVASARELDGAAVARSRLFVDRRESAVHEAGDFLLAVEEGAIAEDHIVAELGDVLLGRARGRERPQEITLFKSLGLAVEDLAAAHHLHREALTRGVGTRIELGGLRDAAD